MDQRASIDAKDVEEKARAIAKVVGESPLDDKRIEELGSSLDELLAGAAKVKDPATARKFRDIVRKVLPATSLVSRLRDLLERRAELKTESPLRDSSTRAIANIADTIALVATGDPVATASLGGSGAVHELISSLRPSLRRDLSLDGQRAVAEAVAVLTISNEDNRMAVAKIGEEEKEDGCKRVVACMLEAAKTAPASFLAFHSARMLRNLSYSEGSPLRWQLHNAGAIDAVEALLTGVKASREDGAAAADPPTSDKKKPAADAEPPAAAAAAADPPPTDKKPASDEPPPAAAAAADAAPPAPPPAAEAPRPPTPDKDSIRFQALQALALIYGAWAHDAKPSAGDKGGVDGSDGEVACARRASEILKSEEMVDLLVKMLEVIVSDEPSKFFGIDWSLGPWSGPLTCRVMATNGAFALELAQKGAVELLAKGLGKAAAWKPEADKPLFVRGGFDACKAMLYMLMLPGVKGLDRIRKAKAEIRAAVEGLLKECGDKAFFSADFEQTVQGILQQLDAPEVAADPFAVREFDVFLSHKRSDSADFARGLYNFLSLNGFNCFLDFEFRDELNNLGEIVSKTKNFVFILTDNIFDSKWCKVELAAAIKAKAEDTTGQKNIVLLVKEGSRWADDKGSKICEFPPYSLIDKLEEEVPGIRGTFTYKAIGHSNEYYGAFCQLLVQRLRRGEPGTAVQLVGGPGAGAGVAEAVVAELRKVVEALGEEVKSLRGEREALVALAAQLAAGQRGAPPAAVAPAVAAAAPAKAEEAEGAERSAAAASAGPGVNAAKALRGAGEHGAGEQAPPAAEDAAVKPVPPAEDKPAGSGRRGSTGEGAAAAGAPGAAALA